MLSFDFIDRTMVAVKKIFEEIIQTKHKVITEELSKSILKSYGVKVPPFALVTSAEEAAKQAKKIGFPLVMKVVSPQILHKTDVGGVKVGLENVNDVKKTFNDMYGRLSKKKGVDVKGILLDRDKKGRTLTDKTIQLLQRRTKIDLSFKRKLRGITKGKIMFIEQLVCYESYLA